MKQIRTGLLAALSAVVSATALFADGPAYPDNWNGGPPLPPIGYSRVYVAPAQVYVQPQYYQPQVVYQQPVVQPQAVVVYRGQVTSRALEKRVPHSDFFWMPEFHPFGPYNSYVDQTVVVYGQPGVTYAQPTTSYVTTGVRCGC